MMNGETGEAPGALSVQTIDEQHRILLGALRDRRKYPCGICHNIFIRTDWDDVPEIEKFPKVSIDEAGRNVLACRSCWDEALGEHLLLDMPRPMV